MRDAGGQCDHLSFFQVMIMPGGRYAGSAKYVLNRDRTRDRVLWNVSLRSYVEEKGLQPGWCRKAFLLSFGAAPNFGRKIHGGLSKVNRKCSIKNFRSHLSTSSNQYLDHKLDRPPRG